MIFWLRASMSAGVPSPDSRQACSPRVSDRRFSSWRTRLWSRAARSPAASRSVCRDARETPGPLPATATGGVPVEECAVHAGGAGGARHADLAAVRDGVAEGGDDALAAAGRVGLAAFG